MIFLIENPTENPTEKQQKPNHSYFFYHCIGKYVQEWNVRTPHFKDGEFYKIFQDVEQYRDKIAIYLKQVPNDCQVLERWFEIMERKAQNDEQRGDLSDLKSKFTNLLAEKTQSSDNAVEVTTENPTTINFSHMESYTPTIPFDMSKWYNVLTNDGVISGVDENLFIDCISHAHMNELFEHGKKAKLRCVVSHLKSRYPTKWFDVVCSNLGVTKQQMGKFNLGKPEKRKIFERKLPF